MHKMKFDVLMLLMLMIIKSFTLVPMVTQEHGAWFGALAMLINVLGYSLLIYGCQTESRSCY